MHNYSFLSFVYVQFRAVCLPVCSPGIESQLASSLCSPISFFAFQTYFSLGRAPWNVNTRHRQSVFRRGVPRPGPSAWIFIALNWYFVSRCKNVSSSLWIYGLRGKNHGIKYKAACIPDLIFMRQSRAAANAPAMLHRGKNMQSTNNAASNFCSPDTWR